MGIVEQLARTADFSRDVMRYYHGEHEAAYRKIGHLGLSQWNDLLDPTGGWTYDNFQGREFLERIIPQLDLPPTAVRAFEYGCGTGPAACFLAARGFHVDATDLIREAITIARHLAAERELRVNFGVGDVCAVEPELAGTTYDLIVDNFCLQSIVTDQDRRSLYAAVRAKLKATGYYLISTAVRVDDRVQEPGFLSDAKSGVVYREVPTDSADADRVEIDSAWYVPHRRHLTPVELGDELSAAGFDVLSIEATDTAQVVCRL